MNAFCREVSLEQADPLPGSGSHASHNLLLSWPIGKWLKSLRIASDMDDEVSGLIDAIFAAGRRVNLIDRKTQPVDSHRAYLMPECRAYNIPHHEVAPFLSALLNNEDLSPWLTETVNYSVALCCTHGKKDKCCAKFGHHTYLALADAVEQLEAPIEVWQSSHLGGCRFAASTMVFPAMHKYGRIAPEQAEALVKSEMADKIYMPCYRGASTLEVQQQVAEVAVRQWLEDEMAFEHAVNSLRFDNITDTCMNVHWQSNEQSGSVEIRFSKDTVQRFDTCADIDEGSGLSTKPFWRVDSIKPLAHDAAYLFVSAI